MELKKLYDYLNAQAFGGELVPPLLFAAHVITDAKGKNRLAGWADDGRLAVRVDLLPYPLLVADLLIHEMVHQAVGSKFDHGPVFTQRAGVVARRMGLPTPGVDGSCWPMEGRPVGFYGPGVVYEREEAS
ncbi:hypothetical protein [Micromonospora sp. CPCC 205561]|uniref:hypothetical protein n=1 Tax=Micromonospora sp. CPCC 205561 TaxID=3122407 RepID=UPI002FEF2643